MTWDHFPWALAAAAVAWMAGLTVGRARPLPWILLGCGAIAAFAVGLGLELGRPPLRTLGETRLAFGLFLPLVAALLHVRLPWRWPLAYAVLLALLFLGYTALHPDTHDRTLAPALRSPWFVPHVVMYLLAYAFLVHTAVVAAAGWWTTRRDPSAAPARLAVAEVSLWVGFGLLTLGLLAGATWAKVAWGHYWSWDPKETWAFLTWATYLAYLHLRPAWNARPRRALATLVAASAVVFLCWFGVNLMPSASTSVHTYSRTSR